MGDIEQASSSESVAILLYLRTCLLSALLLQFLPETKDIIHIRLVNVRHAVPLCCPSLERSTRGKGWHGYSLRRGLEVYSHVSHPHGERRHTQAILPTRRLRKGRG